jgi:hypothetical protein
VPLGFVFGAAVVWLAHPTYRSLVLGGAVAVAGESLRIWAAGHLEKGSEVTQSGPYRLMRHPLYAGSALIGTGVSLASARWIIAALVGAYMTATIVSAIRHEEANMRAAFGTDYDAYLTSRYAAAGSVALGNSNAARGFSMARALRNREYRAVLGLLVVAAIFAFKASRHL